MSHVVPLSYHNLLLHTTVGAGVSIESRGVKRVEAWAENVARLLHARRQATLPRVTLASLTPQDTSQHLQIV